MLPKRSVYGVLITIASKKRIIQYISSAFPQTSKRKGFPIRIVTPNAEQIVRASGDVAYRKLLNDAEVAIPDGAPVSWILKRQYKQIERIAGVDFMVDLVQVAVKHNAPILFTGGIGGVAQNALKKLQQQFPSLKGVAEDGPALDNSIVPDALVDHIVQIIRGKNIRVACFGFGVPKQEYIVEAVYKRLTSYPVILIAVGGSFDFIAGKVQRAPLWMQRMGLEWLFRLIKEPWRVRRQLSLIPFFWWMITRPDGA